MVHRLVLVAGALLALVIAGCGGSSSSDEGGSATAAGTSTTETAEVSLKEIPAQGCGFAELPLPEDPDGVVAAFDDDYKPHYLGYSKPVRRSAWQDWRPRGDGPFTVGIQWAALNTDYQVEITRALRSKLEASPLVDRVILQSTADSIDVAAQIQQLEALIRRRPDLIVLQPVQATAFDRQIRQAADAGIPIVVAAHHIDSPYVVNVQSNTYQAAARGASALVRLMEGRGSVLVLHAAQGSAAEVDGMAAFEAVLEHCPDIEVGGEVTGNFVSSVAKAETLKFLATNPAPIDGIYDIAAMAPGAMSAFEESGRPVPATLDRSPMIGSLGYWADNVGRHRGFATGLSSRGLGSAVAGVALRMLDGHGPTVNTVTYANALITEENLDEWAVPGADLDTPGMASGPDEWIPEEWLDPLFGADRD